MILTAIGLFLLTFLGNGLSYEERLRLILILSIIELVILRIYKFSLKDIRSNYNYFNELPCYLCNQSTIMCIIAALTMDERIMSYCVTAGMIGALLAIFMPDRYNDDQPFYSRQALGFYGYHCLLISTCIGFWLLGLYHPEGKDCIYVMAFVFLLVCIAHLVNIIVRKTGLNPHANYVFTWGPENALLDRLYRMIPCRLFYMLPLLPLFGIVSYIMLEIMRIIG